MSSPLIFIVDCNAFISIRSIITPAKSSSAPIGSCKQVLGSHLSLSLIMLYNSGRSLAPTTSILLTKAITWNVVLICLSPNVFQTVAATPPCSTRIQLQLRQVHRSERSTSTVKSTCPGVSMMLIRCSQDQLWSMAVVLYAMSSEHVVAAEVIVIPLSCSCSIQSIVAVPSCVSPTLVG